MKPSAKIFKKRNGNLRFQIRIQYFKNEATQINLLRNAINNLDPPQCKTGDK